MKFKNKTFVVAGGVAANKKIREVLTKLCKEENFEAIFPPINLCGDNAAMIAFAGLEKFKQNQFNDLDFSAKPRWQLDENAIFYLQSRGINKDKAVSILINAFFDEIIQKINQNIIKDKVHKILSSKIESYLNEH